MKYIKIYESFKLPKYESDMEKYKKLHTEYLDAQNKADELRKKLDKLDTFIKNNNKLPDMINHILDKMSITFKESNGYDNRIDILQQTSQELSDNIYNIFIDFDDLYGNNIYGDIYGIYFSERDNEWVISIGEIDDFYPLSELPSEVLYQILKYLMDDNQVNSILNRDVMKKINRVNK